MLTIDDIEIEWDEHYELGFVYEEGNLIDIVQIPFELKQKSDEVYFTIESLIDMYGKSWCDSVPKNWRA